MGPTFNTRTVLLLFATCIWTHIACAKWAPEFLIIGAPRCATSSLHYYLSQHPLVKIAQVKEVNFFNTDSRFNQGHTWYRRLFPKNAEKYVCGEASPWYLYHTHCPKRVYSLYPNTKIIILIRDPVERAFSHYKVLSRGKGKIRREGLREIYRTSSFATAIAHEHDLFKKGQLKTIGCLNSGMYAPYIRRWLEHFPREQVIVLRTEDLLNDPKGITNRVFRFLDLPEHTLREYKKLNETVDAVPLPNRVRQWLVEFFEPYNRELEALLTKYRL